LLNIVVKRIYIFFFQAGEGIRGFHVTGVQTCALPICPSGARASTRRADRPRRTGDRPARADLSNRTARRQRRQGRVVHLDAASVLALGGGRVPRLVVLWPVGGLWSGVISPWLRTRCYGRQLLGTLNGSTIPELGRAHV